MANIGAEVGQKMRSAIKAKLLELNCYVDDELPDYIMVMVANKRTKSQMKEDLQLFLSNTTNTFVDWLHIVLKKLKEVTVTNPDIYKKPIKRKSDPKIDATIKKEKKVKKEKPSTESVVKSLTDDLPINVSSISDQRKVTITSNTNPRVIEDSFDIPLLSEVNLSTEEELEDIEKKIKSVKNRLGLLVESDGEDSANIKIEKESKKTERVAKKIPIVFENDLSKKGKSVHERLGKRRSQEETLPQVKRNRIDLSELKTSKNPPKIKESALNRLGVMSKISVPEKLPEEPEIHIKSREVASKVKIKPRLLNPKAPQANKNLLLKAVAEAQRSVAQAPKVGLNEKRGALFTKSFIEKQNGEKKSLPENEKNKLKKILVNNEKESLEYVPTSVNDTSEPIPDYVPTLIANEETFDNSNNEVKQKFIVTLDGLEKEKLKPSIKTRLDKKRTPSPIVFSSPEVVPLVKKTQEMCKYWPNCRQPDQCEFSHPNSNCEKFPNCKFGDKCVFLHPFCKFGSSCTKRNCVYSHTQLTKVPSAKPVITSQQICKFFPNCTNSNCSFHHPKLCKFGKFCKKQSECQFTHTSPRANLTWRSK